MKIDSSLPSPSTQSKVRQQKSADSTAPAAAKASTASVSAHLQQAAAIGSTTAPFDSQKVAEIRQAISEGQFKVDADKVASSLIEGVRSLLAKERPAA